MARTFFLNRNFDASNKNAEKMTFCNFGISFTWRHFGSRSSPFGVCYRYGRWCVGKVICGAYATYRDREKLNETTYIFSLFSKKYLSYSHDSISFWKYNVWGAYVMFSHHFWSIFRDFKIFWKKSFFAAWDSLQNDRNLKFLNSSTLLFDKTEKLCFSCVKIFGDSSDTVIVTNRMPWV